MADEQIPAPAQREQHEIAVPTGDGQQLTIWLSKPPHELTGAERLWISQALVRAVHLPAPES